MNPDYEAPGPHEITNNLIQHVHDAIRTHPAVDAKADFGNILARLLARQAKQHAAHSTAGQQGVTQAIGATPPAQAEGMGHYGDTGYSDNGQGILAPTMLPFIASLIAHGGLTAADPSRFHPFQQPENGIVGAVLNAHRAALPHWAT